MAAQVVMTPPHPLRWVIAALAVVLLAGCATSHIGAPRAPRHAADAGLLVLPSGRTIPVLAEQLRYTGRAEFRWPDGRTYSGDWLNGLPHGQGLQTLPDGEVYRGAWQTGRRQGLGELSIPGEGLYQGEFQDGRRQGRGVLFGNDGVYQGEWLADREHGFGELAGAYGSHYTGQWREGQRSGQGSYRGADGSAYQGEWQNDRPHGSGIYRFPDGSIYEGQWQAGREHGNGRRVTMAGVTYSGQWENARRHGFGVEELPDGGRYAGEWRDDQRQGQGRADWPDGSFYEGLWELDRPLGPGRRHYASGIEIEGAWNGDTVSTGLLTLPSGRAYAGPLLRSGNTRASPRLQAWLEAAATEGDGHAQLLTATLYLDYLEPGADVALAREWLARAADSVPEAAFRLGVLLIETAAATETAATTAAGLRWLDKAADAGHPTAARVLGDLHAAGDRVPRDEARAIARYTDALRSGSPLAAERLAHVLTAARHVELRDPGRAIAVLEWVALHEQGWRQLATLAEAYAADHDLAAAVQAQRRAIESAQPVAGIEPWRPRPRPATPAAAASTLIDPPAPTPDLEGLAARLADYERLLTDGSARRERSATPGSAASSTEQPGGKPP